MVCPGELFQFRVGDENAPSDAPGRELFVRYQEIESTHRDGKLLGRVLPVVQETPLGVIILKLRVIQGSPMPGLFTGITGSHGRVPLNVRLAG
jgi:hypothetical protein